MGQSFLLSSRRGTLINILLQRKSNTRKNSTRKAQTCCHQTSNSQPHRNHRRTNHTKRSHSWSRSLDQTACTLHAKMDTRQLLLLATVAAVTMASHRMPHFEFTPSSTVLLSWDDTWQVGSPNMLAILNEHKKINIRVKVAGDTGGVVNRKIFYKCSKSAAVDLIDLSNLTTMSTTYQCASTISFQLSAQSNSDGDNFQLKMGSSKLKYFETFSERVELWVKVQYTYGGLVSNRLFLWSLDPISSLSSASTGPRDSRTFLTDAAASFMKHIPLSTDDFKSIQFLDPDIIGILRGAPDFFKPKINLGAILFFDPDICSDFQMTKSIMFVNHYSKLEPVNLEVLKLMWLNIDDGKLWCSPCGLRNEAKLHIQNVNSSYRIDSRVVKICTFVSFSGEIDPYQRVESVRGRIHITDTSYSRCVSSVKTCEVINGTNPNVTIMSGLDSTAIMCPIICNDVMELFRFYKNGRQLEASRNIRWTPVDGVEVTPAGNIVKFPSTLSSHHEGIYRCKAGSKSFSYTVKVIALPVFQCELFVGSSWTTFSGALPPKLFAMEGEYLSYTCEVRFSGLQTVRIEPVIYFLTEFMGISAWTKLTIEQFQHKLTKDDNVFILNETSIENYGKRLTTTVARVPPANVLNRMTFSHRFECNAFIHESESSKFGMPDYAVQSGSDVVFIPRLTREDFVLGPNNNCSVQKCSLDKDAEFQFSLAVDIGKLLTDIGVDVVPFLRVDNEAVDSENHFLKQGSILRIGEMTVSRRLVLIIFRVTSQELADELVKRKTLTPVFNFRYKSISGLHNLKLDKARYARPNGPLGTMRCLRDPLCFYSTDFDVESSLSFLTVKLNFAPSRKRRMATSLSF